MADDIVQRLRQFYTEDETFYEIKHAICDEAADEIERLRASLAAAQKNEATLSTAIRQSLNVLGKGPCSSCGCDGCEWEWSETSRVLSAAMATVDAARSKGD